MSKPAPDSADRGHGSLTNPEVANETSDINVRAVIWFVIVLTLTAATVHVSMGVLFRVFNSREARRDPFVTPLAAPAGQPPPEPRLQTTPHEDLREFRAAEDQALATQWTDPKTGVTHVPIEKAKDLLLQHGLPTRAGAAEPAEGIHVAASGDANAGRSIPAGEPDRSAPPAPGAAVPAQPPAAAPGKAPTGKGGQ